MYVQGMVTNGVRGVQLEHQGINPEEYGIDWEELDRRHIRQHHDDFNPENHAENDNPFVINQPDRLSHVEVVPLTLNIFSFLKQNSRTYPLFYSQICTRIDKLGFMH